MNSTELYFYIKHLNSLKIVSAYLLYLIHVNMPVSTVDVEQKVPLVCQNVTVKRFLSMFLEPTKSEFFRFYRFGFYILSFHSRERQCH